MSGLHLVCPHCRRINRVPAGRLGEDPKCGACKQPLNTGRPVELHDGDFRGYIAGNDLPVVVDFWAPWCGPCRMMAPVISQVAAEWRGRALFAKVNTEQETRIAAEHAIRSIPTLALFRGGHEVDRVSGALDARRLSAWVRQGV